MPGKRITDHQVLTYKAKRRAHTQAAAAAKAGVSERSARRIESLESLASQRPPRRWRTRPDPLVGIWEAELLPLLQTCPHLSAVTLLEELQRRHPGEYGPSTLRTVQRRLRQWRATHGRLGGAPEEHRTDSLSAAFKNLSDLERRECASRYAALCAHYGMRHSRNNPGESHENGSIESRHGSLKTTLRQA